MCSKLIWQGLRCRISRGTHIRTERVLGLWGMIVGTGKQNSFFLRIQKKEEPPAEIDTVPVEDPCDMKV